MLAAIFCGALIGAVAGCLIVHFVRAWRWRRSPLGRSLEQANREAREFTWTERPIFRGRQ